jgi:hypothetical protein
MLYIILKNTRAEFSWSDGWQFSYTNWFFGRNSSSIEAKKVYCGYLNERNSGWDTSSCSDLNDYMCKITKGKFYILKYFE